MKWYRNHKSRLFRLLTVALLFLLPLVLKANDDEKIKRGVERLNELIRQNAYNDAHGLSRQNKYIFSLDETPETHVFADGKPFVSKSVIDGLQADLQNLATQGIHFYVALNGTDLVADKLSLGNQTVEGASIPKKDWDRILEVTNKILSDIYIKSNASRLNNGKNALLGITPVQSVRVGQTKTLDKLFWLYVRVVKEGAAFNSLVDIVRAKHNSNESNLKTFSKDPDAAIKSHVGLYVAIMKNYDEEELALEKDLQGFSRRYYDYNKDGLGDEEKKYLLKLSILFNKMGITLSEEYAQTIQKEDLAKISRAISRGEYGGERLATYKEMYESFLVKYDSYLKSIAELTIQKDADKTIAIIGKLNKAELEKLPLDARLNALKYLHTIDLDGGFFYKGAEELVTDLISQTPADQVSVFLNKLTTETVMYEDESTSLIYALMDNFDDWGFREGANYRALIDAFKTIIPKSAEAVKKYSAVSNTDLDARLIFWKKVPILISNCRGLSIGDSHYEIVQNRAGKIEVKRDQVKTRIITDSYGTVGPLGAPVMSSDASCTWDKSGPYTLEPFDFVAFIDITNNSVMMPQGTVDYFVPAIFLRYIADQEFKENVVAGVALVIDVALIATGPGAIVAAAKAGRWGLALWELAQVAGSVGNIYANMTTDSTVQAVVTRYNLLMLGMGITKGLLKAGGAFKTAETVNALDDGLKYAPKQAQQEFIDAYKAAQGKLDKITDVAHLDDVNKLKRTYLYLVEKGLAVIAKNADEISSLRNLENTPNSAGIIWKNLDDKNILWYNPQSRLFHTTRTFANEKGKSLYDMVLEGGHYVKLDVNDGRILLGNQDGVCRGFGVIADDALGGLRASRLKESEAVFNKKLSLFMTEQAEKLKFLTGVISKPLAIAGKPTPLSASKVNTILGRFNPDIKGLFSELGSFKNVGLGEVPGGINLLNRPGIYYDEVTWWISHNKPWLVKAVDRGDDIYLATIPQKADAIIKAGKPVGSYGEEITYLAQRDYKPKNITDLEWKNIKFWAGVAKHPNWVEVLDIRTKVLALKPHVLEIEGLTKTKSYSGTTLQGFTGCHSTQALKDYVAANGGSYRIHGKPSSLLPDEVFEGQPIITIGGRDYVKTNGQPFVEYVPGSYGGTSSFFPENWDNARILDEVEYAIKNNHGVAPGTNPSEYFGFSKAGNVEIHFYLNTNGTIGSYFPKKK